MLNFNMVGVYEEYLNTIKDLQHGNGDVPGAVPLILSEMAGKSAFTDISWTAVSVTGTW